MSIYTVEQGSENTEAEAELWLCLMIICQPPLHTRILSMAHMMFGTALKEEPEGHWGGRGCF